MSAALLAAPASITLAQDNPLEYRDRDITLAIETELFADSATPAYWVDVNTAKGIVTLSGAVDSLLARERAVDHAMAIRGVRGVIDRITVVPTDRPDGKIRRDIERALFADPATESYEIGITVNNGFTTLTGTVDSYEERRLAETVAKGIRGVTDLKNDVTVDYKPDRADYEIKTEIERRLDTSVWVDSRMLEVEVEEGTVTLSGTLGSEMEKNRAADLSWVAGVRSVAVNDVETNWSAYHEMRKRNRFALPADDDIETAIEDAWRYDPRLHSFTINAEVSNGVATLNGVVDNLKASAAAEDDALNTVGVWRVKNHLRVRPVDEIDDATIAEKIREAFQRDAYVEPYDVHVAVRNGVVYLSGATNTSFEHARADELASRTRGVVDVINTIDYEHAWTWRPDREIKDDVKWQLFWSPFVDGGDINVAVESGVVTLTGEVDDWSEWRAATENAFEGNAKDVRNNLTVGSNS